MPAAVPEPDGDRGVGRIMRDRPPSPRSVLVGLAIASLLAGAGEAWSYRDGGCIRIMPYSFAQPPSVFGGAGLPA